MTLRKCTIWHERAGIIRCVSIGGPNVCIKQGQDERICVILKKGRIVCKVQIGCPIYSLMLGIALAHSGPQFKFLKTKKNVLPHK